MAAEKHKIAAWVRENFAEGWASETEIAFRAPTAYYSKAVGAVPIDGPEPGVYQGLLDSPRFGILKA